MEKALKKMTGQVRIAALMMVCIAILFAVPAFAFAADSDFSNESPAPGATVYTGQVFVSADYVNLDVAAALKGATVSIGGVSANALVKNTTAGAGYWSMTVTNGGSGDYYYTQWTWNSGGTARTEVSAVVSVVATGASVPVVITVKDAAGNAISESYNVTVASNGAAPALPAAVNAARNATCAWTGCHASGLAGYQSDVAMGADCYKCHQGGYAPPHGAQGENAHAAAVAANSTTSGYCVSCHGSNFLDIREPAADGNDTALIPASGSHAGKTQHEGCSCHTYGLANAAKSCAECHDGHYSATHGFVKSTYATAKVIASGHNTTTFGSIGAKEKWDGTEGVVIKDSADTTITQDWPLPNSGVFWSQTVAVGSGGTILGGIDSNSSVWASSLNPTDAPLVAMDNRGFSSAAAGAAAVNTEVGWDSVITCADCHSGLTGVTGPHGANIVNFGLDSNFPDDWTRAEITSFDPTGMRSIATTRGATTEYGKDLTPWNPYYGMYGGNVNMNAYAIAASATVSSVTTQVVYPGGFYNMGAISSTGYSAASGPWNASAGKALGGRFICQKCHKLTNSYQGLGIEGNGRGFRSNNDHYMGFSNEAHMEHHADMVTGQGNCVSCHIAIPHGWKRPRLLVYESDPLPYKVQWVYKSYRTAGSTSDLTGSAKSQGNDINSTITAWTPATGYAEQTLNGNWGWLGGGTSMYSSIGTTITNAAIGTSVSASTSKDAWGNLVNADGTIMTPAEIAANVATWTVTNGLDTVVGNASGNTNADNSTKTYSSHLERLSAADTAHKQLVIGPASSYASDDTTNGTTWGNWVVTLTGSEWHPDASPNALYSEEAIQNNCTACTSAGTTHSDTGGTSEGVADTMRTGRLAFGGVFIYRNGAEYHDSTGNTAAWSAVPYWK